MRNFTQYSEWFSIPLPFYATQIVNPYINLRISANHDKGDGLSSKKPYKRGLFLYCRISLRVGILANREILIPLTAPLL